MKNPLRSEAEAFQFLLGAVVYFGLIAIAGVAGGRWAALGVFVVLSAAVLWWWWRARRVEPPIQAKHLLSTPSDVRRILVVANETVGGQALRERVHEAAEGAENAEVFVVSPALNSPLRHWASDEDPARQAAQRRLDAALAILAEDGIAARGQIGDSEPLVAIEDALRTFGADEIVISTHPEGRSHWLVKGIVTKARERFPVPVTHVVVDLEAERARTK